MSSRLMNKIPLKILNNPNRYYKTNDDHNAILLQACFDNPIFQEEGNKFRNEDHVGPNDKFPGNNYNYSAGPGRPTEVHFRKTNQRHKQVRIFATVVIAVLLIALIIALLVVFVGKSEKDETVVLFQTKRISGSIRIIQGPYSVYKSSLKDSNSEAYRYFTNSLVYKINAIFHSSEFKSVYNSTHINSLSSGSVIVHFTITFKSSVEITSSTAESIKALLIKELDDSVFFIDINAVNITPLEPPRPTSTVSPGVCQSISLQQCINRTDYKLTSFPNFAGHRTQKELTDDLEKYAPFLNEPSCYAFSNSFFCSLLSPECKNGRRIPPCRAFCNDVRNGCVNQTFPVNCDNLPDSTDPSVCAQNPYKPATCFEYKNTSFAKCWNMGYKTTAFPNYAGSISEMEASQLVNLITSIEDATNCYKHATLLACSAFVPKCTGVPVIGKHSIPPCRSLCEATKAGCEAFMNIFSMHWPPQLDCSELPDVNDTSVCIGYKEAHEPKTIGACPVGNLRCDIDVCVPSAWVCDGYQDCEDNSDEAHCAICPAGQQKCQPVSGQCIDTSTVCDGFSDCYENVDEMHCIRLADGTSSGILTVKDGMSSHWQEVCSDNWNSTFSIMACHQLGYEDVKTYEERPAEHDLKSAISHLRNGSDEMVIQSYLEKSIGSCNSGKVVRLTCENPVCGNRPANYPSQLRIVNGAEVEPGTWPTQVSLHGGENEAYYCGASLLGHNWVLTAGHCVGGNEDGSGITLKIGATRRYTYSKYRQIRKAKNVFVHPKYSPITVDNDIALIELDRPVYFNDFLRPICLPQSNTETPVGTRCYAVGWGRAGESATEYARALREVNLDIVNWDSCNNAIESSPEKSSYKLTDNMICAGGGLDHDACQGDSGGPLLCPKNITQDTWFIAGVISWGMGCAVPNIPGVYTEVPLYVDWIRNITKGEIQ